MKIFVSGSESFVGRELISQCGRHGIEVVGADLVDKSEHGYHKVDVRSKDIADVIPYAVDAVVHLAAMSRDPDCRNKAHETFDVNVMGTLNLMNASLARNAKQFIFASTEWVYDAFVGDEEKDEDSPINAMNHTSEYAFSKLVSEVNLRQKYQHGSCDTTILRFGIIYGPREANWCAVESLFHTVRDTPQVTIGSLKTARKFIHVSDIARGIIKSIGLPGLNVINLQGDRLVTLGEVVEVSGRILGRNPAVIEKSPENVSVRNVSNGRARSMLNWAPEIDIEAGLRSLAS